MKLTKISLALMAACGAMSSGSVLALTASNYANTSEFVGTTQNIRISGASAQDNGILGSALSLCNSGTLHRYEIKNNFAFFCTPDIGNGPGQIIVRTGTPAVTQLAIYKYSEGGSGNGVDPVNLNQTLPFLDLAKLATSPACSGTNLTTSTVDFDGTAGPLVTYVNMKCNTSSASSLLTTGATTYIGLSDVEPAFFTTNTTRLQSEVVYSLLFAVPVTTKLRDALQAQQFGAASTAIGSDSLANMPTLTRAQITSAFTQVGQTWAGIGVTSGLADDAIYVARRVNSSGTQKTFEALIARTPNGDAAFKSCHVGVDGFVQPDSGTITGDAAAICNNTSASGLAPQTFAGSGGGDVSNCLNFHNIQNRGAIGMQTAETKPGATFAYRYVKVDGAAPTQADMAAGKYTLYADASLNTRTGNSATLGASTNNPTAEAPGYSTFVTRLKTDFKNPTIIKLINGADQPFGPSGLMALMPTGGTPDFTGASSVNPWNKLVGGTTIDNCQTPKASN